VPSDPRNSAPIVPDGGSVLDKHHLSIAGVLVSAAFALELDQIEDTAVVEVVRGRRIIGLIVESHLEGMLMLAFQAFQREAEFPFLKDGTHSGAAAGGRREQDRQSFLLVFVLILFTFS
jgi:hypothetical protein